MSGAAAARFRERGANFVKLLPLGAALALTAAALIDAFIFLRVLAIQPADLTCIDFRLFYGAAHIGQTAGWSHIYDVARQRPTILGICHQIGYFPYVNPPLLAWLALPLVSLPYLVAWAIWTILLAVALAVASQLAATPGKVARVIALGTAAGMMANLSSLAHGQPDPLLVLAIVVAARLLEARREGLAGVVLALLLVKPHVVAFVPIALLLAGYWRAFLAWALATIAAALAQAVVLGPGGLLAYWHLLRWAFGGDLAYQGIGLPIWSFLWYLPGPAGYGLAALVAVLAGLAIWRGRRQASLCLGLGALVSLAVTPHLMVHDLVLATAAVWLLHRGGVNAYVLAAAWVGFALGSVDGLLFALTELGLVAVVAFRPELQAATALIADLGRRRLARFLPDLAAQT